MGLLDMPDGDGNLFQYNAYLRLYIIEGCITVVFGLLTFWLLPNKPENAYFLDARDKENMLIRAEQTRVYNGKEEFEWPQVRQAFKSLTLYVR
jgi:hypothetical protein